MMPPRILAVDTASGATSVAVLEGGRVLAALHEADRTAQARRLVPMMEEALALARIGYDELTCLVSTIGPGSFTGLRIGLSAARAAGFAAGKPALGISTLAVRAFMAQGKASHALSLLNAGKQEAYIQPFLLAPLTPLALPRIAGKAEIVEQIRLLGESVALSGFTELLEGVEEGVACLNEPATAIHAGLLVCEYPALCVPPEPLYIRPPDAKLPLAKPKTAC